MNVHWFLKAYRAKHWDCCSEMVLQALKHTFDLERVWNFHAVVPWHDESSKSKRSIRAAMLLANSPILKRTSSALKYYDLTQHLTFCSLIIRSIPLNFLQFLSLQFWWSRIILQVSIPERPYIYVYQCDDCSFTYRKLQCTLLLQWINTLWPIRIEHSTALCSRKRYLPFRRAAGKSCLHVYIFYVEFSIDRFIIK